MIMKKVFLCFCMLVLTSHLAFSQGIKVISSEQIPNLDGSYNPVLSPTGEYIVFTGNDLNGLLKYDFTTKKVTTLTTDAGAGFDVQISSDGNTVVYRKTEYKNRLRYTTLKSINVKTAKETELVKATRNLQGVRVADGTVLSVDNGKMKSKKISGKKVSNPVVTSIDKGQLYVTNKNKTQQISPAGNDVSYLWTSISPDGSKLLYYVIEHGRAYVSNLDGTNPVSLGVLRAAKWMGNNWVIGMVDRDNGEIVISSRIVCVAADGTGRTDLTDSSVIATNPSVSADATKIVYCTNDGKIFLMKIEK